ncbi:MAG: ABC transporter permease [Actinophytocola sp.]|nr:ABC transporter permease [Actinophytocola sp.]
MSATGAIRLVAQRELNIRLRTRSFLIGTAAIIAVIAGYVLLQVSIFGGADRTEVGLSGQAAVLAEPLRTTASDFDLRVETSEVADTGEARSKLEAGELDAVVSGNAAELRVLVKSELDPNLRAILTDMSRQQVLAAQLASAGVADPAAVLAEANATEVQVSMLAAKDPQADQRMVIGMIMVFLLFMAISTYGALVAQGVVEEKASRVVEVLLATVRPWQLLLGKVIGIGLVGLAQLVIVAGAGIAMATAAGVMTLSDVALGTLAWGVLWYLLGYFLYATIYAGAGALVSRQEDAQSVLTPVTMVLVIGFVVGLNLMLQDPDSTATRTMSLVPLLSPILMPGRVAAGQVAAWELSLAIALTLAGIALFTWLGGTIYRNAVLRTGSRMKLADALRG